MRQSTQNVSGVQDFAPFINLEHARF